MFLTDWFRRPFRVIVPPNSCLGCAARQAHIEDLQQLLKSEREGYAVLNGIILQRAGYSATAPEKTEMSTPEPISGFVPTAQRRRAMERAEGVAHPDARKEYWDRVQREYESAGKIPVKTPAVSDLPTVEVDG